MKYLLGILLVIGAASAHADVFKCVVNGKTQFSDQPCGGAAQSVTVKPASGGEGNPAATESLQDMAKRADVGAKQRILDDEIYRKQLELKRLQDELAAKLDALKRKKAMANNNLAGAVWEQSISSEMAATSTSYDTRIRSVEHDLEALNQRRSSLGKQ